jgi:hypothetical protein
VAPIFNSLSWIATDLKDCSGQEAVFHANVIEGHGLRSVPPMVAKARNAD